MNSRMFQLKTGQYLWNETPTHPRLLLTTVTAAVIWSRADRGVGRASAARVGWNPNQEGVRDSVQEPDIFMPHHSVHECHSKNISNFQHSHSSTHIKSPTSLFFSMPHWCHNNSHVKIFYKSSLCNKVQSFIPPLTLQSSPRRVS